MCQLHQMMHRQEETQRRRRLAEETAVRNHHLQSLSRCSHSHIVVHTRQLPWQVRTNHTYESTNGNLSQKIFFSFPSCLPCTCHASSIQTCLLLLPLFYWLIYLCFSEAAWQNISEANVIPSADLQSSKFDKMANVLPSCTGVQLVSVQPCHVKGAHQGEERERCGTLERKGWQEERTQRDLREEREREKKQAITPSFATTLLSLASFRPRGAAARAIGF